MNTKWVTSGSSWLIAALAVTSALQAAPRELVDPVTGTSSGWTWDVSPVQESLVNIVFIRSEGSNFFFEKDIVIGPSGRQPAPGNANNPIIVTFNKISQNAGTLVINDETVRNS